MEYKRKIVPLANYDLFENNKYLLVREGKMKHHTGVYVFKDIFDSGECVLYNEHLKIHYTVPFICKGIKLYKK